MRNHFIEHGHVYALEGCGRPSMSSPQSEKLLVRAIQCDPTTGFDVFEVIADISKITVRRVADGYSLHSKMCRRETFISLANHAKRPAWAAANIDQHWNRVIFTPEACL